MDKEKRYVDVDEVIKTIISLTYLDDGFDLLSYEVIHAIEELPTVGVMHSEWIQNDNGTWSCKCCSSWIPNEQHEYARYCLCCGADMRGK